MSAPVQNQSAQNQTNGNVATTASGASASAAAAADPLPSAKTMVQAAKIAMQDDRAIMMDYYAETHKNTAFLGEDPETSERILVKSKEEFTSLIKKLYKVDNDFIILTENSLYIVSGKIQKRKVNLASLQDAYDN